MKVLKNRRSYLLPGSVTAFALLLFCIERNNPWDFYNGCSPEDVVEWRTSYKNKIDKITDSLSIYDSSLIGTAWSIFNSRKEINENNQKNNSLAMSRIDSIKTINRQIEEGNRNVDCNFAAMKQPMPENGLLSHMLFIDTASPPPEIDDDHQRVKSLFDTAQLKCPNTSVFTEEDSISLDAYFSLRKAAWKTLNDSIVPYKSRMDDSNRIIDSINRDVHTLNSLTDVYNDSLYLCRLPWIDDTTEIQERIDSILPGDTIALGVDSVHFGKFNFKGKGTRGTWTVIIGDPLKKTIVSSGEDVEILTSYNIRFENLIFTDKNKKFGARIMEYSDSITFSHCIFSNHLEKGIDAAWSDNITIDNCLFLHNDDTADTIEGAGIRIADCGGTIAVINSLVAHNAGIGIDIHRSVVTMRRCTISDNFLDGIRYTGNSYNGQFMSYSSLFTFNGHYGIYRNNEQTTRDVFVAATDDNRFFGNIAGEMGGDPVITEDNKPFVNIDPVFVDKGNDDYRIGTSSPLFGKGIGYQYP